MPIAQMSATPVSGAFLLTHTMVAGGPFFGSTGFNSIAGPFGSLTPNTFNGVEIFAIQHAGGTDFSVLMSGIRAVDFWRLIQFQSVDLNWDDLPFRSENATYTNPGGDSQWFYSGGNSNAFINGTTYLVDLR